MRRAFRARWMYFRKPFARPDFSRVKDLIWRRRNGEVNAIRAEWLGLATIRGAAFVDSTGLPS